MTEQAIRDMVSGFALEHRKDVEFAEFCRVAAPGWISGCALFSTVRWEMDVRDAGYDAAMLLLQSRGYRV